jgi:HSP20 family molecular chaperone IbpA
MSKDNHDTDETNESGFVRTVLSDLFETIADMDDRNQRRRTGTGSARSGNSRVDYGLSVGIGPQADIEQETETPAAADTDHTAAVHSMDNGCVVTLDLPDIDPRELSAGVDASDGTLLVGVEKGVIERVALPRSDLEVGDASFNNGVLDVRLRPREDTNE